MNYPYFNPSADAYVTNGGQFFRLKQALSSAGDIFESPQGAYAFALGPDSDISQATIAYLDTQARPWYSSQTTPQATNLATLSITPQRSFSSFVAAPYTDAQYQPANVPGRILIWPTEVYDATFNPPGFNATNDRLIREPPIIDILQFFSSPTTLQSERSDKTYYYDILPFASSQICYVLIPYYGRRYASIWVMNNSTGGGLAMGLTVSGINFRESETNPNLTRLLAATTGSVNDSIAAGLCRSFVIGSGYDEIVQLSREVTNNAAVTFPATNYNGGTFDYLLLEIDGPGAPGTPNASLKVTVSDTVGRTVL